VGIRQLVNGSEVSNRRFVWCGGEICEERDAGGAVTKRFFPQGVKIESGAATGAFFYARDHLGSIRELTDHNGNVRARYSYDPFGRRATLAGDVEADFGFAGMFWSAEASLFLTHYRAYDPELGRWLSRDPLPGAETLQGPNLYAYVLNDPVNAIDPEGLLSIAKCLNPAMFSVCASAGIIFAQNVGQRGLQAVRSVGQSIVQLVQRTGSAIRDCFSRAPSPPPAVPQATPRLQLFIEEGKEVAIRVQTLPGVGPVGWKAREIADMAARRGQASAEFAEEFLATQPQAWQWWYQTMQATRQWRESLPTIQQQFEASRLIDETAELLLGKFW
jgi:RHS repeat-associated protein